MELKVKALDHFVLTVADIPATTEFYGRLGMETVSFEAADGSHRYALRFGVQKINLHQQGAEFRPHAGTPTAGSGDLCFLSDTPVSDWVSFFQETGMDIQVGPVKRTGATGPILSIYIRDPDGNLIEIANQIG